MPLVIEDGTGIAGATSYITVAYLRGFCGDRGIVFPAATDPDTVNEAVFTPFIILANDYLESLRDRYAGVIALPGVQELSWPRQFIFIDCLELPIAPLPTRLLQAQAQLCVLQMQGIALQPSMSGFNAGYIPAGPSGPIAAVDNRFKTKEKIDVLETEWSQTIGGNIMPIMPSVMAFLKGLLADGQEFYRGVRI